MDAPVSVTWEHVLSVLAIVSSLSAFVIQLTRPRMWRGDA